jgi:hypothetical protein
MCFALPLLCRLAEMLLHKQQCSFAVLIRRLTNNQSRTPLISGRPIFHHLAILTNVACTPDPADSTHQTVVIFCKAKMLKTIKMVDPYALQAHLTAHSNYLVNVLLRAVTLVFRQHRCTKAFYELASVRAIEGRYVSNAWPSMQPELLIFCRWGRACISPSPQPRASPGGMTGGGSESSAAPQRR